MVIASQPAVRLVFTLPSSSGTSMCALSSNTKACPAPISCIKLKVGSSKSLVTSVKMVVLQPSLVRVTRNV